MSALSDWTSRLTVTRSPWERRSRSARPPVSETGHDPGEVRRFVSDGRLRLRGVVRLGCFNAAR